MNAHLRMVYLDPQDPRRCDHNLPLSTPASLPLSTPAGDNSSDDCATDVSAPVPYDNTLYELARRRPQKKEERRMCRSVYCITASRTKRKLPGTRDLISIQSAFQHYTDAVWELASPQFWKFFLPLHSMSGANIDTALLAARNAFLSSDPATIIFPPTRR